MSWVSAVAGLAGSLYQNSMNQASAQASMDFQREVLQNRNQWAVEDLKKAGLNPILAAGATQSSAAGAQATNENPASGAMSGMSTASQIKIAKQQQANNDAIAESVVKLNGAKAVKELAEASDYDDKKASGFYGKQADSLGASADFTRANIVHLGKEGARIENEIEIGKATVRRIEQDIENAQEDIRTAKTVQQKNQAEARLASANADLSAATTELRQAEKAGVEVNTRLKELDVPGKENEAYYQNHNGQWIHRTGLNRLAGTVIDAFGAGIRLPRGGSRRIGY